MSRKTNIAQENVSKLASLGVAAMEYEAARRSALNELTSWRRARKDEDVEPSDAPAFEVRYATAARLRKNARERMLRMIARYRDWLDGVNS